MEHVFDRLGNILRPNMHIPTSEGNKTIPEIMDHLQWCSYKNHRDRGETSHELLVKHGIGTEAMKLRYEKLKK